MITKRRRQEIFDKLIAKSPEYLEKLTLTYRRYRAASEQERPEIIEAVERES